jgi:hypothetical protein
MASSAHYRRQSELCLQLALLQADLHADLKLTFWMLELAKKLRAKAGETDDAPVAVSYLTGVMGAVRSSDPGTQLH